jgi:hypothetical protein
MKVTTFRATCNDCHTPFDNPLLSDMSYGEFIARGEKGTAFAYLPAMGNPGWDRIDQLFKKFFPKKHPSSETECFQWILGKCLDSLNDQELSIVSAPVCPNCHDNNLMYGDDIKTGELDLPDATFSKFFSLDDLAQEQMVNKLCSQWLEKPTKPS